MFPFQPSFPYLPNQNQNGGSNYPAHQQVMPPNQFLMNSNNVGNNQFPCPSNAYNNAVNFSQLHGINSQFQVPFNGNFAAMPNTQFPNFVNHNLQLQNSHLGRPFLSGPHNLTQPSVQFCSPNALHNLNSVLTLPQSGSFHNFPQNLNQLAPNQQNGQFLHNQNRPMQHMYGNMPAGNLNPSQGMPYGAHPCSGPLVGCSNQGVQNMGSHMNQQLGSMTSNEVAKDQSAPPPTTIGSQGNTSNDGGNNMSNSPRNHLSKNFARNHHESGKGESPNPRFKKSKFQPRDNVKGNVRSSNGKGGKGNQDVGTRKPFVSKPTNQNMNGTARSLSLHYSEQEIQKWREERKKNHPMRSSGKDLVDKQNSESIDEDTKKRRQQLKEILAKQAELGVEVAEVPPIYLTDSENQVHGKKEEPRMGNKNGKFKNKYGKRGRRGNSKRFEKKQKLGEEGSFSQPDKKQKQPTLLQKLLSSDIKRDKSHLLQVFRFMVTNSFFKDWPEKSLEFPSITVKDSNCKTEVIEKKSPPLQGDNSLKGNSVADDDEDIVYGSAGKAHIISEKIEHSEEEEGEITD